MHIDCVPYVCKYCSSEQFTIMFNQLGEEGITVTVTRVSLPTSKGRDNNPPRVDKTWSQQRSNNQISHVGRSKAICVLVLPRTKVTVFHVDDTTQTLAFSHEIESFVHIFKWQVMCYVLINLDFLHFQVNKTYISNY